MVLLSLSTTTPIDEMKKIAASGSLDIVPVDNGLGASFRSLKHVPQPKQSSQVFIDPNLLSDVRKYLEYMNDIRSTLAIVILLVIVPMDFKTWELFTVLP